MVYPGLEVAGRGFDHDAGPETLLGEGGDAGGIQVVDERESVLTCRSDVEVSPGRVALAQIPY